MPTRRRAKDDGKKDDAKEEDAKEEDAKKEDANENPMVSPAAEESKEKRKAEGEAPEAPAEKKS